MSCELTNWTKYYFTLILTRIAVLMKKAQYTFTKAFNVFIKHFNAKPELSETVTKNLNSADYFLSENFFCDKK